MKIKGIRLFGDCILEATFFSGDVKLFDVKQLFDSYPSYKRLAEDEDLWKSATLLPHGSGVYFNDDIDLTAEEIWKNGEFVKQIPVEMKYMIANAILYSRMEKEISQSKLSSLSGVPQCDISRIEGAVANPTIETLSKLFSVLNLEMTLSSSATSDGE